MVETNKVGETTTVPVKNGLLSYITNNLLFIVIIVILCLVCVYLFNKSKCDSQCEFNEDHTDRLNYATEPENESKIVSIKDDATSITPERKVKHEPEEVVELTPEEHQKKELLEYYSPPAKKEPKQRKKRERKVKKKEIDLPEVEEVNNNVEIEADEGSE